MATKMSLLVEIIHCREEIVKARDEEYQRCLLLWSGQTSDEGKSGSKEWVNEAYVALKTAEVELHEAQLAIIGLTGV